MMTKNFVCAIVLLGVATIASAETFKSVNSSDFAVMKSNTAAVFKVVYHAQEKTNVKISIADASGKILFHEDLNHTSGFVRPYNLSMLPEGKYILKFDDGHSVRSEIISNQPMDAPKKVVNIIKLNTDENKVALTMASVVKDEIVVSILDANNNVVHKDTFTVEGEFGQLYNMKDLKSFTIQVSDSHGLIKSISY